MKHKALFAVFIFFLSTGNIYSLNIVIIESQSFNSGHVMDTKWLAVASGMGHTASIMPQTTLDNNVFFATTDILIVSSGVIVLPANRVTTIQQFIQQGGDVYIQSEYDCSVFTTNAAFASIVNALGGIFSWQGIIAGTLAPMNILGTLSNTNNSIPSLAYFWYGCQGTSTCGGNIESFLQYTGNDFGFIFCPPNPSYGRFITSSDQDWIIDGSNVNNEQFLMENIITNLSNPAYSCISTGGLAITILSQTNVSCFGGNNGNATINATGGSSPYTYSWSTAPVQTSATATGLNAGSYTVTVTDASGCSNIQMVNITQPNAITITALAVNASCGNNNGSSSASPSGGTSPYTYSWSTGPVQTTATATGLGAGSYTVIVTDASGCSATQTVTLTQTGAITVNASAVNASCGNNNGSASASPGGGTSPYTYSWSTGPVQTSATATGLGSGSYTVIVTDASGCSATQTVTLTQTGAITVNAFAVNASCGNNNGSASASSSGGTSPYTYSWSTVPVQSSPSATGLTSGTYTVTVIDNNGCTQTQAVTLAPSPPGPTASVSGNVTITQGQSVSLTASGGGTYVWNNSASGQPIVVSPGVTTYYCVTVTDANNCTDTSCMTVTVKTEPIDCSKAGELYIPNAFSPNGDGENDKLQIYYGDITCVKIFKLVIYNRWGEKVFESLEPGLKWDGSYNGKMQSTAVFTYYLEATLLTGEQIIKKGSISLLR